jgi:uncharacterized protein YciI
MKFDRYTVVLLRLRPDAPAMSEEDAAELQDRHLAFRAGLLESGLVLAGGPLVDQDDESLRGLSVWSCDAETARAHAELDPAVVAGRLSVSAMAWMTVAGNVEFKQVKPPRSMAEVAEEE